MNILKRMSRTLTEVGTTLRMTLFSWLVVRLLQVKGLIRFPSVAGANRPLRLCDQGMTGRGPHPSFRARIVMRGAQTAARRFGDWLVGWLVDRSCYDVSFLVPCTRPSRD